MASQEYLQALRSNDYTFFLEWPEYITQKYLGKNAMQDADTTLSLIVFEWMQCGFLEEDIAHIALIYAFSMEHNGLLEDQLAYASTAVSAAAMQCMVYRDQGIMPVEKPGSTPEILDAIQKMEKLVDPEINNAALIGKAIALEALIHQQQREIRAIQCKLEYRLDLKTYMTALKLNPLKDLNYQLRLGVVQALYAWLMHSDILNPEVQKQIQAYINQIRNLTPGTEEQHLLNNLTFFTEEKSYFWNAFHWGCTFFLAEKPAVNAISGQEEVAETKL